MSSLRRILILLLFCLPAAATDHTFFIPDYLRLFPNASAPSPYISGHFWNQGGFLHFYDGTTDYLIGPPFGSTGTVTSFSASFPLGLFSCSVATPTTTPALTCTLVAHIDLSSATDIKLPNFAAAGCQIATAGNLGCLSAADWTLFNAKQAALSSSPAVSHQFLTAFTAPNTFTHAQPACGDLSDSSTGCSTIALATNAGATHKFFSAFTAPNTFILTQPSCGDLSDAGSGCTGTTSSGGTVTNFTAGNLSPLFTTNVATATTTPALTFAIVNQSANLVYAGPSSGAAAAPTFRSLVQADLPSASIAINGTTCTLFSSCTITAAPSGSAGGDLGGTYPNPTVLHGTHITDSSIPNSGLVNPSVTVNTAAPLGGGGLLALGGTLNVTCTSCATGGSSSVDLQTFDFAHTGTNWSKPTNAKIVIVTACGAGGGGGGGSGAAAGSIRAGGGGGGGGVCVTRQFLASDLTGTVLVTIGQGGPHGAGGSATSGADATAGGTTTFGSYLPAPGGGGGAGNSAGAAGGAGAGYQGVGGSVVGASGNQGGPCFVISAVGTDFGDCRGAGSASVGAGGGAGHASALGGAAGSGSSSTGASTTTVAGGTSWFSGGGGGNGGGVNAASPGTAQAGADGGGTGPGVTGLSDGGGTGGTATACASGGNGVAGTNAASYLLPGGTGGGGGASINNATGCTGGAGGIPAGGGGAGGGGTNTGGAGGDGGNGFMWVWTLISS